MLVSDKESVGASITPVTGLNQIEVITIICVPEFPIGCYSFLIIKQFLVATSPVVCLCLSRGGEHEYQADEKYNLYAVANSRKIYTVFAMEIGEDLNVRRLDVRKIDKVYRDYAPEILLAPDGTPYVFIESYGGRHLSPVLIPFSKLKKTSKTYGIGLTPE